MKTHEITLMENFDGRSGDVLKTVEVKDSEVVRSPKAGSHIVFEGKQVRVLRFTKTNKRKIIIGIVSYADRIRI